MKDDRSKGRGVTLSNSDRNRLAKTGNDTGSFVKKAVESLDTESRRDIANYAAKKAVDLEAKKYEQEMDLDAATRDIENHIDAFEMLNKDGRLTRNKLTSDLKSGAGNMRLESKSGASCFIATVCYGDIEHPDLDVLRNFRDQKLAKTTSGSKFIDWYYDHGPSLAHYIAHQRTLKMPIFFVLRIFVWFLKKRLPVNRP